MSRKDRARMLFLINQLSRMGQHGWHNYTCIDWQPLEAELAQLRKGTI